MFTIKFYSGDGCRQIIREAESFTILRCPPGPDDDGSAEITLHQKVGFESCRIDIGDDSKCSLPEGFPPRFAKAIIENSAGRTTEIIQVKPRGPSASHQIKQALRQYSEQEKGYTNQTKVDAE
jgi:hypothetical protein